MLSSWYLILSSLCYHFSITKYFSFQESWDGLLRSYRSQQVTTLQQPISVPPHSAHTDSPHPQAECLSRSRNSWDKNQTGEK